MKLSAKNRPRRATVRDYGKFVGAIIAGIPADQVNDKMQVLTERREALERQLLQTPATDPIRIHPKMAAAYQHRVWSLISDLSKMGEMQKGQEALGALVDRILL